jgi:hypothetical protein
MGRRERDFAGVSESDIHNMKTRAAPLGWSPRQWKQAQQELHAALRADGLKDADVRIHGSSTTFASLKNPEKSFPRSEEELVRRLSEKAATPDQIQRAAEAYRAGGFSDGSAVPRDMFWDASHRLGLGERSDYDVQISSDALEQRMTAYQAAHPDEAMRTTPGDQWQHWFWDTRPGPVEPAEAGSWKHWYVGEQHPTLNAWVRNWERELGRQVNLAGFNSHGPEGISAFRSDDWILKSPGA